MNQHSSGFRLFTEENYRELEEAVYFFDRVCACPQDDPFVMDCAALAPAWQSAGLDEAVCTAVLRILLAAGLLRYAGAGKTALQMNGSAFEAVRQNLQKPACAARCEQLFRQALQPAGFFFDNLSEQEYEIYCRCNYEITFAVGLLAAKIWPAANGGRAKAKVLEPGGNSGGFAAALLQCGTVAAYTVVDRKIPVETGRQLCAALPLLQFVQGDFFDLQLGTSHFDQIVLMNILHDFNDADCLRILRQCLPYGSKTCEFLVIEDILTAQTLGARTALHGLRLSASCRGGRRRTKKELTQLLARIGYTAISSTPINSVYRLLRLAPVADRK